MSSTINIEFNLKDYVEIIPISVKGRITSIWITEQGIKYQVRYFDNAKIEEHYFYGDELKKSSNKRSPLKFVNSVKEKNNVD